MHRLIHEALMGNISNMRNSQDDVSSQIGVAWEEDEDDYDVAGVWHVSRFVHVCIYFYFYNHNTNINNISLHIRSSL